MTADVEKLKRRIRRTLESLPILQANASDPEKDSNGCCSNVLAGTLRSYGIAQFILDGDRSALVSGLTKCAECPEVPL